VFRRLPALSFFRWWEKTLSGPLKEIYHKALSITSNINKLIQKVKVEPSLGKAVETLHWDGWYPFTLTGDPVQAEPGGVRPMSEVS
jgi:hypothetical protein